MEKYEVLEELKKLTPPQFAELIYVLNAPRAYLPHQNTTQVEKAIALLEWASGSDEISLTKVQETLKNLTSKSKNLPSSAICNYAPNSQGSNIISGQNISGNIFIGTQHVRSNERAFKKILLLSANPLATGWLRVDEEMREIKEGLRRAKQRELFVIESAEAVRYRDLRRQILDNNPNIVHFSGHGAGEDGLVFEDESGKIKYIESEALAGLFKLFADSIECVVLNACYSTVQADAIARHIPYVVGMGKAIGDRAAIEFAIAFYDAVGAGRDYEFAFELACNAINLAGIAESDTPKLLKGIELQPKPPKTVPDKKSNPALKIWLEKLDYLQQQEAIASNPAIKFELQKQIEECQQKIRELGG